MDKVKKALAVLSNMAGASNAVNKIIMADMLHVLSNNIEKQHQQAEKDKDELAETISSINDVSFTQQADIIRLATSLNMAGRDVAELTDVDEAEPYLTLAKRYLPGQ